MGRGVGQNTRVQLRRVIGYQYDLAWEDAVRNRELVGAWLAARRPEAGSLVVLPEMFASGFSMNAGVVAEPPGGGVEVALAEFARRHGIWLLAGLAVRHGEGAANEAVGWGPDGVEVVRYRKQRLFTPGGEPGAYLAGTGPAVFEWGGFRVAPFICYDLRFPELFREATRRWRPELYVVIASWPEKRVSHWTRLLQARAIEGQAYVLGVNRTGTDPHHVYPGGSIVVDPMGEIVAEAGRGPGAVEAVLDEGPLREYRAGLRFLDDQRPMLVAPGASAEVSC